MELFEEGGEVDEVSGNNIPLGSTAKEVRDDQPAMLSEGEMVIPADVVRYFGVEYFMKLRDQAKLGYKKMEAMGQFGTEKGQTLPDDTLFNAGGPPFTIEDIEVIEDYEEDKPTEKKSIEAAEGALITDDSKAEPNYLTKLGKQVAFDFKGVEDIVGVDVFNYLKSFLPKDILKGGTAEEIKAVENYSNNLTSNLGISTSTTESGGGENPPETGGLPSVTGSGSTAQGTGDINTLMSYPTTANINGLKSFASLLDTTFGKSVLGAFGFMVSAAINPGQVAPVVGLVQRGVGMLEKGLMGTSKISDGFSALRDIPVIQANMANRAARSFDYDMKNMTKEERDAIDAVFSMQQFSDAQGYGNIANNPNATIGITSRGEVVGKFSQGPLAATYNARGEIVGDKVVQTFTPQQIKDAYEKGISLVNNATFAANPNTSYSKTDPGQTLFGGWGGPVDVNSVSGGRGDSPTDLTPTLEIASTIAPTFGRPDDDDIEYDNKIDYGGMTGAGTVLGAPAPGFTFNDDAGGGSNSGGGGSGGGTGGTGGTDGGFDVADAMGDDSGGTGGGSSGSDAGDSGDSSGQGSPGDGGEMAYGGLIKRRNTKKKKARRGLAGR